MPLIDALIELAQFRISDRHPGALNQLVAQSAVARAGDRAAILFLASRMLARDQSEKSGNLPHVGNQRWISQPRYQMRRDDYANAGNRSEQADQAPQFRIVLTEVTDLMMRGGGRIEMEMQRADQLDQLKAHRLRARQLEQLIQHPRRPVIAFVRKRYPFIEQQRFDATFGGRQLLHVRVAQLHQMAQLAILRRRARGCLRS